MTGPVVRVAGVRKGLMSEEAVPHPILVVNPSSDRDFRTLAKDYVEEADGDTARLEAALRARYPRTVVRSRDLSGDEYHVWYAYREGFWVKG